MKGSPLLWLVFGAAYGLVMRLLFGPHSLLPNAHVVSLAFLLGSPFAIGAIVVYGLKDAKPSIKAMLFAPWAAIILALIGSAATLLEGSVCIVLAAPIFLIQSSVGGLIMGLVLRWSSKGKTTLQVVAVLPILLVFVEPAVPQPPQLIEERVAVEVAAAPHRIWEEILNARNIRSDELAPSFVHWIGVPKPVEGVNVATPEGEVRFSKWERGVNFSARVTQRETDKTITWRYHFTSASFPPGALDDHVKIGGEYFDLYDTTFNLVPLAPDMTRLEIVSHYRVTTNVNFYAMPVARLVAHDFMMTILQLYKSRSERAVP